MSTAVMVPLQTDTVHWNPDLALSRLDGDAPLLASVIALMRSLLIRDLPTLVHCMQTHDFMGIRQLTHAQLPSLKMVGFDAPAQIFEVFESLALMSDWQACERMMRAIESIWMAIIEALDQRLPTQG
ncbi:MAG: hypothetical protein ACOYB1_12880 [Limnohabitans sp.]